MRLTTDLESGDHFFTDLNGFQMIKRKKMNKLPLQANYYPIPSMAYIQVSIVVCLNGLIVFLKYYQMDQGFGQA